MPKKRFPCGHVGNGKFCHRCKQADQLGIGEKHEADRLRGTETPEAKEIRLRKEDEYLAQRARVLRKDPYVGHLYEDDFYNDIQPSRPDWREERFGDIQKRGWNH